MMKVKFILLVFLVVIGFSVHADDYPTVGRYQIQSNPAFAMGGTYTGKWIRNGSVLKIFLEQGEIYHNLKSGKPVNSHSIYVSVVKEVKGGFKNLADSKNSIPIR